jgi:hypothetical protein
MIIRCNLLKKKKNQVDGDVKKINWGGRDAREEVNREPGEKESGGKLLKKIELDFVAWVAVLQNQG